MNTTKEQKALKLALDFVEDVYLGEWRGPTERQEEVISAIKEALMSLQDGAQQNPQGVSNEQVEPVAWRSPNWGHSADEWIYRDADDPVLVADGKPSPDSEALYTHPPVPNAPTELTAQPKE